ncbi:MAG: ABC transporter ATP-binding protein/permease [Candidatus Doudnabacteria bacterium]|nr:ABC transporter ATP-binding protein/permease [Candidatus Doudnabacteria bacterium]
MLFSMVTTSATDLYVPLLYKKLFNLLTSPESVALALGVVWMVLAVKFINWFGWRAGSRALNFWQPKVMADLVNSSFEYLQGHSYNFFTNRFAGSLVRTVNRFERAFEDISDIIFFEIGQTFIRVSATIIILFFQYKILGLIVLVWVILYCLFILLFARYKLKYDVQLADTDSAVTGHLSDTISNNINLKIFGGTKKELVHFKKLTDKLFRLRNYSWNLSAYNEAIQGAMFIFLEFAAIYTAVHYWGLGRLTLGDIILVQGYITLIFNNSWNLGRNVRRLYERIADAKELTDILLTPHEVMDVHDAKSLKVVSGEIVFKNVGFKYNNQNNILHGFNLSIPAGQRVALVGPSGGGKTTLIKLLFRFMDIQAGQILIDGSEIAKVTQESLRNNIALVPQEPILFHRSLFDNISYAKPNATKAEVEKAAKLAHAHEFIMNFPDKYGSFVGERGVKLSGGERQRVAIARAILKNAPILVLDEATSSLDSESESLIQDALHTLMKGRTTIAIAHRLSTIKDSDRIIVIESGKIVADGDHKTLLKVNNGIYQKLWEIQAGGFETAESKKANAN